MSSTLTAPSCIDTVTDEVLERVLSFIPRSVDVKCGGENPRTLNQTLALMQVSRRFRRITQQSKLWLKPAFRFDSLIPGRPSASSPLRCARLVETLFQDPYFKTCLERKCAWFINSGALFSALRNITRIVDISSRLRLRVDPLSNAIPHLSLYQNLATLVIESSSQDDRLDLGSIPRALPRLKDLTIFLPANLEGSLRDLSKLESLALRYGGFEGQLSNSVLPLGSAKTLTRLFLDILQFEDDFALRDFASIRHFRTDLCVSIVEDSDGGLPYVEFLRGTPWSLKSFKAKISMYDSADPEYGLYCLTHEIEPAERNKWLDLLLTPCFKNLLHISLDIDWENVVGFGISRSKEEDIYEERCEYILETMSTEWVLLEKIELRCAFVNEHCVKRWENLKSLVWLVPSRDPLDSEDEWNRSRVLEQFQEFVTKPEVIVRSTEWREGTNHSSVSAETAWLASMYY
jgi:F-box domain